ncbi:MAG: PKD domain-containing protein [Candidatus Hodarchaeota archaeon]
MKKQLIIVGIAIVLLSIGLSGCNEQNAIEQKNQTPTAFCSADITSGEAPLVVSFTGSGTDEDGTIISYHWDFDSWFIDDSTEQNPTVTFTSSGIYDVILTVKDNNNATGTDTVTIIVEEWHEIEYFSGKGYDITDDFMIEGRKFKIRCFVAGEGLAKFKVYPVYGLHSAVDTLSMYISEEEISGEDESICYFAEPGAYYIEVDVEYNQLWNIQIYDWY